MTDLIFVSANEVRALMADGRIITIRTDDGSAAQTALQLFDWSDMFRREDDAEEITQIIEAA
jgi:hypothetical protein